jgi:hypothetical protein
MFYHSDINIEATPDEITIENIFHYVCLFLLSESENFAFAEDFETQAKTDPDGDDMLCMKEVARFLYQMDIGFTLGKHPELVKPM